MVGNMNRYTPAIIGLYRSDYSAGYHLRQIAALLKVSHSTLFPHLNKLLQAKLLVSRKAGRSKLFSLNLENILAKDYLLQAEILAAVTLLEENFLLKKIYSEVFALAPAGAVVLFGSYAKKKQDEESDIDLLYIGEKEEQFAGKMKKAGSLYGKEINVKKTTLANFEKALRKKDSLIQEVLKSHVLLHRPSVFVHSVWRYFCEIR